MSRDSFISNLLGIQPIQIGNRCSRGAISDPWSGICFFTLPICADVHEDILTATIRLGESVSLFVIEPLHGSLRHTVLPLPVRFTKAAR
jgi:hypothetical protein